MHVSPTSPSTQPVSGPLAPPASTSGSLVQAGFRTSTSADLQIVTADGDTVTISSDRTSSIGYAGFSATSGGTRLQGEALQVSAESSVSLSVQGSLDAKELADIKKVVKLLERAATAQDASQLLKRLSHAHLDSLSSVQGTVERTTEFHVVQASGSLPEASDATPPGPAATLPPPTSPPPLAPSVQEQVDSQPSAGAGTVATAPSAQTGDFLFAILASMLRSPAETRAA